MKQIVHLVGFPLIGTVYNGLYVHYIWFVDTYVCLFLV